MLEKTKTPENVVKLENNWKRRIWGDILLMLVVFWWPISVWPSQVFHLIWKSSQVFTWFDDTVQFLKVDFAIKIVIKMLCSYLKETISLLLQDIVAFRHDCTAYLPYLLFILNFWSMKKKKLLVISIFIIWFELLAILFHDVCVVCSKLTNKQQRHL